MSALELRNIKKSFGHLQVLNGINLTLDEGGFLVLLGPSGCGKSTLLSIIAGLEDASDGEVEINGVVANDLQPKDRNIAMVFQSYALYPSMQVERNMAFGLEMRGVDAQERGAKVNDAAHLLGIEMLLERKPGQLSGGQRQRVAMGRALVRSPELFLLDEPLSNLDAKLRTKMRGEIKKLHQDIGATIVYVTHDQVEAMTLATKVAIMRSGDVVQVGTPMEIYRDPENLFVAGFIGSPPMNFLHGSHIVDGTILPSGAEDAPIALPDHPSDLPEKTVLGIRPEGLKIVRGDLPPGKRLNLTITPEVIEPMGADTMVHFWIGNNEMVARVDGFERIERGAPLKLSCAMDAVYFFDAATEQRVRSPG